MKTRIYFPNARAAIEREGMPRFNVGDLLEIDDAMYRANNVDCQWEPDVGMAQTLHVESAAPLAPVKWRDDDARTATPGPSTSYANMTRDQRAALAAVYGLHPEIEIVPSPTAPGFYLHALTADGHAGTGPSAVGFATLDLLLAHVSMLRANGFAHCTWKIVERVPIGHPDNGRGPRRSDIEKYRAIVAGDPLVAAAIRTHVELVSKEIARVETARRAADWKAIRDIAIAGLTEAIAWTKGVPETMLVGRPTLADLERRLALARSMLVRVDMPAPEVEP